MSQESGPDYAALTTKKLMKITNKFRYNIEVKKGLNEALVLLAINSQEAYESIVGFIAFDLKNILAQETDQSGLMIDYITNIFQSHADKLPQYKPITEEYDNILNARVNAPSDKENSVLFEGILDEFYRTKIVSLLN